MQEKLRDVLTLSGNGYIDNSNDFKKYILEHVPGLQAEIDAGNHFAVTSLLRTFAYKTRVHSDELNTNYYPYRKIMPAHTLFNLYKAKEISFQCEDASIYLSMIYDLFGYSSALYHHGITALFTHVTTLVKLPCSGKLIVQDATSNCTFCDANSGEPLDFFDMIELIVHSRYESIYVMQDDCSENNKSWFKLCSLEQLKDNSPHTTIRKIAKSSLSSTDLVPVSVDFKYESFCMNHFDYRTSQYLEKILKMYVGSAHKHALMLFPIHYVKGLTLNDRENFYRFLNQAEQYNPVIPQMAKIVLFGASEGGLIAQHCLRYKYNIIAFCDSAEKKWGKELLGIKILPPSALNEMDDVHVILSMSYLHAHQAYPQIKSLNIKHPVYWFNTVTQKVLHYRY